MDLEELRAFLAVAERGSFLAAATELRVPRGTLRRQIDALEARAGVLLLERSARGVTLTRAGELLCVRGRALLDEGAALLAAVRATAREEQGPLRVQVPIGLPPEAVVNFVRLARTFAPERSWRLTICDEPAARCDDADIALYLGDEAPPSGWQVLEILRVPIRVVASEAYLRRHGCPQTPAQLREHALAAWSGPQIDPCAWPLRGGSDARLALSPSFICNDIHALHELARAGLALTLLPDARLDLLGIPDVALTPVLPEIVGRDLSVRLAISGAVSSKGDVQQAAMVIAGLSRSTSRS